MHAHARDSLSSSGSIIIVGEAEKIDMQPTDKPAPAQFEGRRVAFKNDAHHSDCWHYQSGLATGVVLRVAPSLAQKAELLGTEGIDLPEWLADLDEVPRLWVKVDPCPSFPRGCEAGVEMECLVLVDSTPGGAAGSQ
jgi:hypothetical protein